MLAVELRPEERRGPLQDFIRALELAHLLFKLTHPSLLVGRDPGFHAVIDISLAHPGPHRLNPVTELLGHARGRSLARTELDAKCAHHPDRSGFLFSRVAASLVLVLGHESILHP